MRRSSSRSVQSEGIESSTSWKSSARGIGRSLAAAPAAVRPAEVAAQPPVAVSEEGAEERPQQAARQRQARLPGDPVGDRAAAVRQRLDRALVFPEALAEHRRALEEAPPRLDPLQAQ